MPGSWIAQAEGGVYKEFPTDSWGIISGNKVHDNRNDRKEPKDEKRLWSNTKSLSFFKIKDMTHLIFDLIRYLYRLAVLFAPSSISVKEDTTYGDKKAAEFDEAAEVATSSDELEKTPEDRELSVVITGIRPYTLYKFELKLPVIDDDDHSEQQYGTTISASKLESDWGAPMKPTASNFLLTSSFMYVQDDGDTLLQFPASKRDAKPTDYELLTSKYYRPHEPIPVHQYSLVDDLIDNFHEDTFSDVLTERRRKLELVHKERQALESKLTPLSKDQLHEVYKFWKMSPHTVVASGFQIELTARDLQTLCDRKWLNDNIFDFYFGLITAERHSVFGWTTHFYTTLKSKGYPGVARWAKRKKLDVTKKDMILVPINVMDTHWALAVVNNKCSSFEYYDSLSHHGNTTALNLLRTYMIEEGKKQNSPINFQSYSLYESVKTPQQENGYDCGVFTCTCANYLSRGKGLTFSQRDMPLLRRRMAYEIISKKLLP